jgi:uncharacterized membrane protein YfcA
MTSLGLTPVDYIQFATSLITNATDMLIDPRYQMKTLTLPPTILEVVGVFVILLMAAISSAGGLGAGATVAPFVMIFFGLSIFECVPLANFFGLLSAFTRFLMNVKTKHPNNKDRLIVYYEIIELTMPILYLGTLIGVQVGTTLNEIELAVSLACVLLFVAVKTLQKGM